MIRENPLDKPSLTLDHGLLLLSRLIGFWRPPDGWLALTLLTLNLMVVAWSVERADWVPTPNLAGVMLLGILTSLILSRIPLNSIVIMPIGFLVGALFILGKLSTFQDGYLELAGTTELINRLESWFHAARTGGMSIDPAPFAFALMTITWMSGLISSWLFCRKGNFWGVFIIGTAGLLSNLTFLPDSASIHLGIYLLTALLLVARIQSVRRRSNWDKNNIQYDQHLGILSISDSIFIAIAVMILAFILPIGKQWGPTNTAYELARTPLLSWEDDFNRLFAGLPARKPLPYRIWGDVMAFQGTINPASTPVLLVHSPTPLYWKARTYRTYTPKGWASLDTVLKPLQWSPTYSKPKPYLKRVDINYAVTHNYGTKNLFIGGHLKEIDRDVRIETYDSPIYILTPNQIDSSDGITPEVNLILDRIRDLTVESPSKLTSEEIRKTLLPGYRLVSLEASTSGDQKIGIAEVIPSQADILSIQSPNPAIKAGDITQVTASISTANEKDLKLVSTAIPSWVLARYTQLPLEFPEKVRDLTQAITLGFVTQYDKTKAIETYLRENLAYNLRIQPLPYNVDGVEHFLFSTQEGYSEYFASAMTVMLRTQGIPARLVTGYSVGDKLPDDDIYLVRDKHSHAWVEVFFSQYGWIPFEPTPGAQIPLVTASSPEPKLNVSGEPYAGIDDLDCLNEEDCEDDDDMSHDNAASINGDLSIWDRFINPYLPWYLAFISISIILTISIWIFWVKTMSASSSAVITFQKLLFFSNKSLIGTTKHLTPYELQALLNPILPNHQPELEIICSNYVESLYAKKDSSEHADEVLANSWKQIRFPLLIKALLKKNS